MTLFMAFVMQFSFAQEKTVTGVVTSAEEGLPLPGVSVLVKGTARGAQTDFDGKYSINVRVGETLAFSFVSMKSTEVVVGASNTINVTMQEDVAALDEVVIVAYGEQSQRSIVGAMATVSTAVMEKQQLASVATAIQGSVPGVNVISAGGQPGDNPTIRIRGVGSMNASSDPLIVVDGAPFYGNLNSFSGDQIESMNVLKDASATALYGSRAANGVILINTKKGKRNTAPSVSFNTSVGVANQAVDFHDFLSTDRYMELNWEALRNTRQYINGDSPEAAATFASNRLISDVLAYNPYGIDKPVGTDGRLVSTDKKWDTNWADLIQNEAGLRQEHSLSVSGGSDKTTYAFMSNYLDQEGSVKTSNFKRVTTRINLDSQINDWLSLGVNMGYSTQSQNYPDQSGTSYQSAIQWIYTVSSVYPLYRRDGGGELILDDFGKPIYDYGNHPGGQSVNKSRPALDGENAVGALTNYAVRYNRDNFTANGYGKIDISDNLSYKANFAYERFIYDSFTYAHNEVGYAANVGGRVSQNRNLATAINFINSLNYKNNFGDNHNLNVDLIQESNQYKYDALSAQGVGFLPNVQVLNSSTTPESVGGYISKERLYSYLGRVAYNFKNKYFIEGSYRSDASTRFAENVRRGDFFSVGGSWIVSDENFLSNSNTISLLKLRASYGELGNKSTSSYFPYLQLFNTGWSNGSNAGVLLGGVVDPMLSWEKTATFNVGLDFGLFNDRIVGSVDYYDRESIDLINSMPLPSSTGSSSITTNIGSIRNYGLEVSLTSRNIVKDKFTWTTNLNFSLDRNEVTKLTQDGIISGTKRYEVGRSLFDFWMQEWAGVDPEDGYGMWYKDVLDAEGNPTGEKTTTKTYADASRNYVGKSSLPNIIGGLTNTLQFGNFDFNVLFNFSLGSYIYDSQYAGIMNGFRTPGRTAHADLEKRWQKPGDITDVPLLLTSNNSFNSQSDRFLFKNDYVRLKALTLGYSLPKTSLERYGISNMRLYLQGDNLFTFQSHKGIDPEQSLAGTTNFRSYNQRIFSIGLNISL